jgi:hypothetical protein
MLKTMLYTIHNMARYPEISANEPKRAKQNYHDVS